jgi:hypothetical protein
MAVLSALAKGEKACNNKVENVFFLYPFGQILIISIFLSRKWKNPLLGGELSVYLQ